MIVFRNTLLASALFAVGYQSAMAEEVYQLTVGSSHPEQISWVEQIHSVFIPEVERRLAHAGGEYRIKFNEAYGGQLYGMTETLDAVGDGIVDIGWVFSIMEPSQMPLSQISSYAPGVTGDPELLIKAFNELNRTVPALAAEWKDNNIHFLGATAGDTIHLYSSKAVEGIEDFRGLKVSAPGVNGLMLGGTGAVAVDAGAPTYYTNVSTGVTDAVLTSMSLGQSIKLYEVAPEILLVNFGAAYTGGLGINKDVWDDLPEEVQTALSEAGQAYSAAVGPELKRREAAILDRLTTEGPGMEKPVSLHEISEADRNALFSAMPDLVGQWIDANSERGLPANDVLNAYMTSLRAFGATPARDWDARVAE